MPKRFFEYHDKKSDKFWEIEVKGKSHSVRFGRCGTVGQTKQKDFASANAAQKAADKLIGEKTHKGYVERTKQRAGAAPQDAPASYYLTLKLKNGKERNFPTFEVGSKVKLPPFEQWEVMPNDKTTPEQMKAIVEDMNARKLKYVDIGGSTLHDGLLPEVVKTRNLRELTVMGKLTDRGMKSIGKCLGLEDLSIGIKPNKITDQGLACLRPLKRLKRLELWDCPITDRGFKHISTLEAMEDLELYGDFRKVTDTGVLYFRKLKSLKHLLLNDSLKISREAMEKVADALPDCDIECKYEFPRERRAAILRKREDAGAPSGRSAAPTAPSPTVMKQVKRLGGAVRKTLVKSSEAEVEAWPEAIRKFVCGITWPKGVTFAGQPGEDALEMWMVQFCGPDCGIDLSEQECCEGRSFAVIGITDGGNYFLIVPLDCKNPADPPVYQIDHFDPEQVLLDPVPLSKLLTALEPESPESEEDGD